MTCTFVGIRFGVQNPRRLFQVVDPLESGHDLLVQLFNFSVERLVVNGVIHHTQFESPANPSQTLIFLEVKNTMSVINNYK